MLHTSLTNPVLERYTKKIIIIYHGDNTECDVRFDVNKPNDVRKITCPLNIFIASLFNVHVEACIILE